MEENKETVEEQKNTKKPLDPKLLMMVLAAAVVVIMMIVQNIHNNNSGVQKCEMVPQSPWGQSSPPVWVDTKTPTETRALTGFEMTIPDAPEGYENAVYKAYTLQVFELRYLNDEGKEGLRVDKAKLCGQDVFDYLYTDKSDFNSITKVEIGDLKVTEKGDGEKISVASWIVGEYSYSIGAWDNPLSKEEMEALVLQVK